MNQEGSRLAEQIKRCQAGEREGFSWLLEEYGSRLYGYFLRRTGSAEEAEDLMQDLFVQLMKKMAGYEHRGLFEPWLFRVAANLARDRGRRRQRQKMVNLREGGEKDAGGMMERWASKEAGPAEQIEQRENRDRVQKVLEQMSDIDREIILVRHYGGLSFKEIAQMYGIPMGTALAKVHRGLKFLRMKLEEKE